MQEIIVSKQEEKKIIAIVENGKLQELYEENEQNSRLEGNIYIGKVKNILPGMQAAFVDIGEEKATFIHIKDIMPKASTVTGNKNEDLEEYNIKDYIKSGENILVQVKKDSVSTKGARISKHIHIPGRFVVVLPENDFVTVSQKVENEKERERLINIVKKVKENRKIGIIVRTAAEGRTEKEIEVDILNTIKKYEKLQQDFIKYSKDNKPRVLLKTDTILQKILLDTIDNGIDRIIVDDKKLQDKIIEYIKQIDQNLNVNVELRENILNIYDIDDQIEKTKNRKIWLKCGGFITIDKTEALTAIDVNSGKFTGKDGLEQTILKVNEEASIEIAKQIRLRDIGGIIIIDYIDMYEEKNKQKVIEKLSEGLKKDRAKTQIMEFTKLNLLELTRKHMFSGE